MARSLPRSRVGFKNNAERDPSRRRSPEKNLK